MNRRRWLVGASCCLAGTLLFEMRARAAADGPRTLEYWMGLASILGCDEFYHAGHRFDQATADVAAWQLREIDALPPADVDAELLAFVRKLPTLRDKMAAAARATWPTATSACDMHVAHMRYRFLRPAASSAAPIGSHRRLAAP